MKTFELEFEVLPVDRDARETVEAAQSLAERAADLLDQAVEGYATEHAPEPLTPGAVEYQDQNEQDPTTTTDVVGEPQPPSDEAANCHPEVLPPMELDAAVVAAVRQAKRKMEGARGHYMGETVGAYVGRMLDARRIKPHSNHHGLGGVSLQIRTINGRQTTFTKAKTDPDKIIVAAKKRDASLQGASRYNLYGVLRDDTCAVAKKSQSKGHVNSGHQLVSLAQVRKVELGSMVIPDGHVQADTSEQRSRLLDRIRMLEADLDNPTVQAVRLFLAAEPLQVEPEALDTAPTSEVDEAAVEDSITSMAFAETI
jgi:hypothetical protein